MNLRLYSAEGANCCERVRWALDHKLIKFDLIDLDDSAMPAEFVEHSPFGRVPLLVIDGQPLSESMAIVEYIEEIVPEPNMLGASALARARVREVCEAVNSSIHPVQNSSVVRYFHPTWSKQQMRPGRAGWITSNLVKLENRLWRSSPYAVGNTFTLADVFVGVIYRKAISLGASQEVLAKFDVHWSFLMSQPAVKRSCPTSLRSEAIHQSST